MLQLISIGAVACHDTIRYSFLNQVNRPIESNFRAFQNLLSDLTVEGVHTSLYNLTKSVPDPFLVNLLEQTSQSIMHPTWEAHNKLCM